MDEKVEVAIRKLLAKAQERFSSARAHQIGFAAVYAEKAHAQQTRESGEPFVLHPLRVAQRLLQLDDKRVDDVTIIAALLHDVVEDTAKTTSTIQLQFGRDVSLIVDALTKRRIPEDKKQEDEQYFEQISKASSKDARVALVKLCDQLDNARDFEIHTPARKQQKVQYLREFFIPLAQSIGSEKLQEELTQALSRYEE